MSDYSVWEVLGCNGFYYIYWLFDDCNVFIVVVVGNYIFVSLLCFFGKLFNEGSVVFDFFFCFCYWFVLFCGK